MSTMTNGKAPSVRPLTPGIYVPIVTFFNSDKDQSLDLEKLEEHVVWLARAGVTGITVQGSTAEAVALTREERVTIIETVRKALHDAGFKDMHINAGAGAQSTREAIFLAKDAAKAGADSVLILPPSFFASGLSMSDIIGFYEEIADESPIPVVIYSWPAASGGNDLSADVLGRTLAKHPNIIAVKQTDNSVSKMARNVQFTSGGSSKKANNAGQDFLIFGGGSDYLLGALAVGAHGSITGMGNVTPRVVMKLFNAAAAQYGLLSNTSAEATSREDLLALQGKLSVAEFALLSGGIPSIKASVEMFHGRGGVPRRPVPPSTQTTLDKLKQDMTEIVELERQLEKEAGGGK